MTHNDSIMNHCPHCDSLCLLSHSEVDAAQAANKAVAITCHQCNAQFGLEHNRPTGTKRCPTRRDENCRLPVMQNGNHHSHTSFQR